MITNKSDKNSSIKVLKNDGEQYWEQITTIRGRIVATNCYISSYKRGFFCCLNPKTPLLNTKIAH